MNRELISVIDEIGRQKGIDKARVIGAIESALQTAAKKRFGQAENIQVEIDPKTGEISVVSKKTIVETVSNPKAEISLQEARQYDSEAEVGDEIGSLIEMNELGRIAAQTAKQVIFQKVREAEWEAVQKEYSTRQGDLVTGIILGMERRNYLVDLGKTEAILPIQEQIPRETYRRGDRVKAMLLEVRRTPKDVQVILSRSHPQFVSKLFELEVPEIMEKIIEIKSVVREPGDRTKIAVTSREKAVDPVGACVGIKGSRVQAVVRELRGEKIDIITWTQDPRVFIAEALNPATIEKVGIDEEKKSALVVAADSQLSLAIGKNGQNVRLAARLTGWKIDIISATEYEKEKVERDKEIKAALAEETEAQRLQEEARQAARAEEALNGSE
ncbi:MAG: transcription termination/antitermination protein NusA [Nitrospira sp.]|jgi:N utilization substance protein A|uniref:Transcription termination/antitermination protein NusA n=1 Tax=Candidatus Nitrospira nitrosa TaxID=1742972 RepID=A0A0S4LC57_9BACT|nr:transcription termination factor NusA [Candidatus Nitrospira nitrosa]MBK8277567.1 transcription termination/antitermination protein NusA [Nitrospira sp.]MBK9947044.1 transcription termination/antitermination protein NusA [Nitrospira sp.]MBL8054094.1 transcription termination/antitermination protein NusA [Nitrospira sp.]CUS33444.1 Transcription termination/antitermination protein NusA [Candidatus Nitrospira nitrosa]HRI37569.1 transcription termination factor NusA [Nitrospira sp.]